MTFVVSSRSDEVIRRRGIRLLLLLSVVAASTLVLARAERFFDLDKLDVVSAETVVEEVQGRTEIEGSAFKGVDASSPFGYAVAVITVLFRPLPSEARNAQSLIAATEGVLLAVLIIKSRRNIARLSGGLLRSPYLLFCVAYTAAFVYAFASIHNFGILVRQRSQLLPVFFVLVSLVPRERRASLGSAVEAPIGSGP